MHKENPFGTQPQRRQSGTTGVIKKETFPERDIPRPLCTCPLCGVRCHPHEGVLLHPLIGRVQSVRTPLAYVLFLSPELCSRVSSFDSRFSTRHNVCTNESVERRHFGGNAKARLPVQKEPNLRIDAQNTTLMNMDTFNSMSI